LLKEILIVTLAFLSQLAQAQQIKSVEIQGLKRTQVEIVYREIGYTEGDSVLYSDSMRAIWEQRLQATKLFNRVQVQKLRGDTLPVVCVERWYYWFQPEGGFADRNFHNWWQNQSFNRLWLGGSINFNNVIGEQKVVSIKSVVGFNQAWGLGIAAPFKRHDHCGAMALQWEHQKNHEMGYISRNNRWLFYRLNDRFVVEQSHINAEYKYRFQYHQQLRLSARYERLALDTAIWRANPDLLMAGTESTQASASGMLLQDNWFVQLGGIRDTRNFIHYPTQGSEWKYAIGLHGLHRLGQIRWVTDVESRYRKFLTINQNTSLAWMCLLRYRGNQGTYLMKRQLGYGMDYVRGNEALVADGNGLVLSKLSLRQSLFAKNTEKSLHLLPKAYQKVPIQAWFNIFADVGKVIQPYQLTFNTLGNRYFTAVGTGLDCLFFYDALMRFDWSYSFQWKQPVFNVTFYHAI
jgi:outer membrane protein assembly factor BamA